MTDLIVNIDKIINAPIEKVFDAWLDPRMLSRFMVGMPGMSETDVEIDAREGGRFTFTMHLGDDHIPHTGEFLVIRRPDKLVFTWESAYSVVDDSTVALTFIRIDDRKTKVSLSHIKLIDEEARSGHEKGWRNVLETLDGVMRQSVRPS